MAVGALRVDQPLHSFAASPRLRFERSIIWHQLLQLRSCVALGLVRQLLRLLHHHLYNLFMSRQRRPCSAFTAPSRRCMSRSFFPIICVRHVMRPCQRSDVHAIHD